MVSFTGLARCKSDSTVCERGYPWLAQWDACPDLVSGITQGCISEYMDRTTAFTCRAGCKERDVSKNRDAGPVKCNALVRPDHAGHITQYPTWSRWFTS